MGVWLPLALTVVLLLTVVVKVGVAVREAVKETVAEVESVVEKVLAELAVKTLRVESGEVDAAGVPLPPPRPSPGEAVGVFEEECVALGEERKLSVAPPALRDGEAEGQDEGEGVLLPLGEALGHWERERGGLLVGEAEAVDAEEGEDAGESEAAALPVAAPTLALTLELAVEAGEAEESTLALAPAVTVTVRVALCVGEELRVNCSPGRLALAGAEGEGAVEALMVTHWEEDSVKVALPVAEGDEAEE